MIGLSAGLRLHAKFHPDQVAIVDERRSVTYEELWDEVQRLTLSLSRLGIISTVGLLIGNTIEHIVALFAVDLIGGSVAPLNPHWSRSDVDLWHDELGIELTITDRNYVTQLGGRRALIADKGDLAVAVDLALLDVAKPPSSDATYLYALTGGTSGTRKSIQLSRESSLNRIVAQIVELGPARKRRLLVTTPLFHGAGRSLALSYLWQGASVHLSSGFDPNAMARALSSTCQVTFVVPTMVLDLIEARVHVPSGTEFICSGAPLFDEVSARFRETITTNLYNYFASVEGGGLAILGPEDAHDAGGSVGHVMFGTDISLVDQQREAVARGGVGEILVRNESLASGMPLIDGWYATGDLGYFDDSHRLVLCGRQDDRIISGGVNVDPLRVEQVINELPGIREVAVVGVEDARWGQRVVAAYVQDPEREPDLADIQEQCRARLTPAERPKEFRRFDHLPRTTIGKPDRKRLRQFMSGGRDD